MTRSFKHAGAVLAAAAVSLSLSGAGTAVARPAAAGGSARNCVVSAEGGQSTCFGGYREAIKFATGGRVVDAPLTAAAAARDAGVTGSPGHRVTGVTGVTEELNGSSSPSNLVVLGTIHQDFFFEDESVTFTGPHDCYNGNSADHSFDIPAPLGVPLLGGRRGVQGRGRGGAGGGRPEPRPAGPAVVLQQTVGAGRAAVSTITAWRK